MINYEYKDYKGLQTNANDKVIEQIQDKIKKIQNKKSRLDMKGISSGKIHKYNVLINLYQREINSLKKDNKVVQNANRDQVIKGPVSKLMNYVYEKREEKINEKQAILEAQKEKISKMNEGKIKGKAQSKVRRLEKKINRLQKKNFKTGNRQVALLKSKTKIKNYVQRRHVNKMLAQRDEYKNQLADARAAQTMPGLSNRERKGYTKDAVKYVKKIRKLNTKLQKIRTKRIQAQGGNARTIPNRRNRRRPTR